jgi:(p)ppGpp synthase/HD superfamily hydrolase
MKKGELLNRMLVLATNKHSGQYDKGGTPYILHPLKVMHYLKTDDEELQCIALGHDLLEDTDVTIQLLLLTFTDRIARGILSLTKIDGESYENYKDRVKANPDAILVKMCDLRHNTDIRRLKGISKKDFDRMEKYHRFYKELQDCL